MRERERERERQTDRMTDKPKKKKKIITDRKKDYKKTYRQKKQRHEIVVRDPNEIFFPSKCHKWQNSKTSSNEIFA